MAEIGALVSKIYRVDSKIKGLLKKKIYTVLY
jgi:hypothetical protein